MLRRRCPISEDVNLKTNGEYEYRLDLMRQIMLRTGENTKAGAIMRAMESYLELLDALDRAGDHPDMTDELAGALSTPHVEVVHRTEHEMNVR